MCICFPMRQLHALPTNSPPFPLCRANDLPQERQTGPRFHMLQLLERYFTPTSAEAVKQALQQLAEQLAREQESKGQVGSPALSALQSGRAPLKHADGGPVRARLCFPLSGGKWQPWVRCEVAVPPALYVQQSVTQGTVGPDCSRGTHGGSGRMLGADDAANAACQAVIGRHACSFRGPSP